MYQPEAMKFGKQAKDGIGERRERGQENRKKGKMDDTMENGDGNERDAYH